MDRASKYFPSHQTVDVLKRIKPLFLVGPTSSGKDTVQNELLKTGKFYKVVTYTTRQPRENNGIMEVAGQDYHFISEDTAIAMMDNQEFIEVAINHANLYGTSLDDFTAAAKQNKIPVLDIDVKGVSAFNALSPNFIAIFLLPSSFEVLRQRLMKRYGGSAHLQDINNRLRTALFELEVLLSTDYYYSIINEDIQETVNTVLQIVDSKYSGERISDGSRALAEKLRVDIRSHLENT